MAEWMKEPPVIERDFGTNRTATQKRWVKAQEWDEPEPALVTFVGGKATTVAVLGQMYTHYASTVAAWGPEFAYRQGGGDEVTLDQARERMMSAIEKPNNRCPCCGQRVQLYRRGISIEMATYLIALSELYVNDPRPQDQRWYLSKEVVERAGVLNAGSGSTGSLLMHWGLVERSDASHKKLHNTPTGSYRPTQLGFDFVSGAARVRSKVYLLHNEPLRWDEELITIRDIERFDYDETVRGVRRTLFG